MGNQSNPQCTFIGIGLCIASANSIKWSGYWSSKVCALPITHYCKKVDLLIFLENHLVTWISFFEMVDQMLLRHCPPGFNILAEEGLFKR